MASLTEHGKFLFVFKSESLLTNYNTDAAIVLYIVSSNTPGVSFFFSHNINFPCFYVCRIKTIPVKRENVQKWRWIIGILYTFTVFWCRKTIKKQNFRISCRHIQQINISIRFCKMLGALQSFIQPFMKDNAYIFGILCSIKTDKTTERT